MVMLKELAVEMLNNLPAENLENKPQHNDKMAALKEIQKYRGKLPEDFDYKKELEESREERYAGIN
ncbi:MAG: dihydrodipicolinate reductase [Blautia sp.]|nr:dihydrodipicolinate reductase [Blautia sp.]